jgi:hypothetical protein
VEEGYDDLADIITDADDNEIAKLVDKMNKRVPVEIQVPKFRKLKITRASECSGWNWQRRKGSLALALLDERAANNCDHQSCDNEFAHRIIKFSLVTPCVFINFDTRYMMTQSVCIQHTTSFGTQQNHHNHTE